MAHPHHPFYIDGDYSTPIRISRTPREYPFAQNGDITTAMYDAIYVVSEGSFTPTARGTVDPENAGFYLIRETKPEITQGKLATFRRAYARIPTTQTRPWSGNYSRPAVPGTGVSRNYGTEADGNAGLFYQPDAALDRFKVYTRRAVATDQGVVNAPTGGTYPMDFLGDATAGQAYNASAATLKAALDALGSVTDYGGLATLTGNYNDAAGFLATFNNFAAATLNAGGLTYVESSLQSSVVTSNGGWTQQVAIQLVLGLLGVSSGSMNAAGLTGFTHSQNVVLDYDTTRRITLTLQSSTNVTAGSFTITLFGQTATVNYADSEATVLAALNALSAVVARGGVTVSTFLNFGVGANATTFATQLQFGSPPFTAGTHTLTPFGQTTAGIAYNASTAAIQTALNLLSEVTERGGVVVSGTGLNAAGTTITFTLTFSAAAMSGTSSLTPAPSSVLVTLVAGTNGRQQYIKLTAAQTSRLLTFTNAHGFESGQAIYLKMVATYHLARTDWIYVSPTQISVNPGIPPWSTNTTITEGGKFVGEYAPGPAEHRGKIETLYYLPGVTPGVTTFDDIPDPLPSISDARYLDAITIGQLYVSYATGAVDYWEGPILSRETTYIKPHRSTT